MQLGNMVHCTHGWKKQLFPVRAIAKYSNYGCYCGVITGGDPKDNLDKFEHFDRFNIIQLILQKIILVHFKIFVINFSNFLF